MIPPLRPTVRQRLLGAFIVVQIVFLLAANVLPLFPHGRPDSGEMMDDVTMQGRTFRSDILQETLNIVGTTTRRYGELTGQMQGWSLFAPMVAPQSPFLIAEMRWLDDAGEVIRTERLGSSFEPENPRHYVQMPGSNCRLFNYEFRTSHPIWYLTEESLREQPIFWQEWMPSRVSRQWRSMRALLRVRLQEYARLHPSESAPDEVVLSAKIYPIPKPGVAGEPSPVERPIVRWRPGSNVDPHIVPVEVYDHVAEQFFALNSLAEPCHE